MVFLFSFGSSWKDDIGQVSVPLVISVWWDGEEGEKVDSDKLSNAWSVCVSHRKFEQKTVIFDVTSFLQLAILRRLLACYYFMHREKSIRNCLQLHDGLGHPDCGFISCERNIDLWLVFSYSNCIIIFNWVSFNSRGSICFTEMVRVCPRWYQKQNHYMKSRPGN